MAQSKTFKRNDTGPPIKIQCLDGDTPMDLTTASSVKFLMGKVANDGTPDVKVQGVCTVDADPTTGLVYYDWQAADLDTAGTYSAEIEVTWSNGDIQTFPEDSYLTINVMADVG